MRIFSTILTLGLFAAATATEIEGLVRRTKSTSDFCGCFSGAVSVRSKTNGNKVGCGTISTEICICISQISDWLNVHDVGKTILQRGGITNAISCVTDLIGKGNSHKKCDFPKFSRSRCHKDNVCDYDCDGELVRLGPRGSQYCGCPGNKNKCGDKCQRQPCPSGLPQKRDLAYWGKKTQQTCRPGWTACGVFGGGPRDWECVDTRNDLESCGGCAMDLLNSANGHGLGVDCTTLPGVADVSCVAGGCAVHKCLPGYKISRSGQHCEEEKGILGEAMRIVEAAAVIGQEYSPF
ncbi:hypothetical protein BDZ89DRAFT_1132563 [Hymenopellis radicata]|nr:hypothetical protein BDZ89DRAFT_1132563 [Hymenopellis radicata]